MNIAKIFRKIQNMTMLQKLTIGFLSFFITPIFLIGFISYESYEKSIKETTINYVTQISEEMINKLDTQITKMEGTTLITYYMTEMQDDMKIPGNSPDKVQHMLKYISLLNANGGNDSYAYVFDSFGNVFSRSGNNERSNIKNNYEEYKKIVEKTNGEPVILGTQKVIDSKGRTRYYLTVLRRIIDLTDLKQIGIAVVDADIGMLSNSVQKLESLTGGKVIIIDKDEYVIYDNSKELIGQKYSDNEILKKINIGSSNFDLHRNGNSYMCISSNFSKLNWKLIVKIPETYIMKDAKKTSRILILIFVLASIVALCFFFLLSISIIKPLRKLIVLMKKVQNGDLDVQFNVKWNDEVGMVCTSFNNMVSRLKELINEIYFTKLRKKQLEIETLQKQINPHFIYNTLETVRMLTVLRKTEDLNDVMYVFGKLLRYSINYINDIVTIKDEFKHLEDYVYLQNKCFDKRIMLDIQVNEPLEEMSTIKLIFQPIIENSIIHGFRNSKKGGTINIISEQIEGFVIFRIRDNGKGINPEDLFELNNNLKIGSTGAKPIKKVGIMNVSERIKLYYGNEYGLKVTSEVGIGTEIVLMFPEIHSVGEGGSHA